MMQEEICTYEVAKLAKEKGFPQDVDKWLGVLHSATNSNYYNHKGELNGDCIEIIKCKIQKEEVPKEFKLVAAPTQSLLQRWLREEKKWNIVVRMYEDKGYYWFIQNSKGQLQESYFTYADEMFDTYELALENALAYALENLV